LRKKRKKRHKKLSEGTKWKGRKVGTKDGSPEGPTKAEYERK
jgi:hypothetical protein